MERRSYQACLIVAYNFDDHIALPLVSLPVTVADSHVLFDPIDPYHRSGLPKRKVLYGPNGYLGKEMAWKKPALLRLADKVESWRKSIGKRYPSARLETKQRMADIIFRKKKAQEAALGE